VVCDLLGIDVWEVIDAAGTKPFGFMKFTPGPGLGGHCIPIDPLYLAWKMRALNYKTRLIDVAGEVNSEMPRFWVERIARRLNEDSKAVRGSRILVIGASYKKDIDDMRESPAVDIMHLLEERGADVRYHDPYVPEFRHDGTFRKSVALTADELAGADCVVIATDHSNLDYQLISTASRRIVDTRNALKVLKKAGKT
jgi:UDP-N-acetyl-D-glucosamine dehydrogenase